MVKQEIIVSEEEDDSDENYNIKEVKVQMIINKDKKTPTAKTLTI